MATSSVSGRNRLLAKLTPGSKKRRPGFRSGIATVTVQFINSLRDVREEKEKYKSSAISSKSVEQLAGHTANRVPNLVHDAHPLFQLLTQVSVNLIRDKVGGGRGSRQCFRSDGAKTRDKLDNFGRNRLCSG